MRAHSFACAAVAVLALGLAGSARAEDAPVIQYDPITKAFSAQLPFHTAFTLDVPAPSESTGVSVTFWKSDKNCSSKKGLPENEPGSHAVKLSGKKVSGGGSGDPKAHYQVGIPPLRAGGIYCMIVDITEPWTTADTTTVVDQAVNAVTAQDSAVTQAQLTAAIQAALGPLDQSLVAGGAASASHTVAEGIRKVLWSGERSRGLSDLFDAAQDYATEWGNLVAYRNSLAMLPADARAAKVTMDSTQAAALSAVVVALEQAGITDGAPPPKPPTRIANTQTLLAAIATLSATPPPSCPTCSDRFRRPASNLVANLNEAADRFAEAKQKLTTEITAALPGIHTADRILPSASPPTYVQEAAFYISGDVGFMIPFFVNTSNSYGADSSLYVAASFSFAPIDKDVPLAQEDGFLRRFSVVAGFTLNSIKNTDGTITGVLSGKGIMAGVGLRLTDYLRVGAGFTLVRQNDVDKLLPSDSHLRAVPYVSLSIDADVVGIVTGIFKTGAGASL